MISSLVLVPLAFVGGALSEIAAFCISLPGLIYIPTVLFMQELGFRGFVQTMLKETLGNRSRKLPVAVSSLWFSTIHIGYGWQIVVITFLLGLLLGGLFERQRSLLGVVLLHYLARAVGVAMELIP